MFERIPSTSTGLYYTYIKSVEMLRMLTIRKSEIKSSTPASFHDFQAPKVVIGLISNHFQEFW